jgi:hypothetical protein
VPSSKLQASVFSFEGVDLNSIYNIFIQKLETDYFLGAIQKLQILGRQPTMDGHPFSPKSVIHLVKVNSPTMLLTVLATCYNGVSFKRAKQSLPHCIPSLNVRFLPSHIHLRPARGVWHYYVQSPLAQWVVRRARYLSR